MPYQTIEESVDGTMAYVLAAVARDQPVLIDLPGDRLNEVRDALGPDARHVAFSDMSRDGRNPASIIPGVMHRFIDDHPGRRAAIIAEPMWPGRSTAEYTACLEHEALINLAFAQQTADILCRYDVASLPQQTFADIQRTHPRLREKATQRINPRYQDPALVLESISNLQPQTPEDAPVFRFSEVAEARRVARDWGAASGLAIRPPYGSTHRHQRGRRQQRGARRLLAARCGTGGIAVRSSTKSATRATSGIASPDGCRPHGSRSRAADCSWSTCCATSFN